MQISVPEICQFLKDSQQTLTEAKQVSEDIKTKLQTFIKNKSEHEEILYSRQDDFKKANQQLQRGIGYLQNIDETDYDRRVEGNYMLFCMHLIAL